MLDNKLKYLIIGVVTISLLTVAGAYLSIYLFNYRPGATIRQKSSMSPAPLSTNLPKSTTPILTITYPSAKATASARFKTAPAPKIITASGSASGTGPAPKSIPKP